LLLSPSIPFENRGATTAARSNSSTPGRVKIPTQAPALAFELQKVPTALQSVEQRRDDDDITEEHLLLQVRCAGVQR